MLPLPYTIVLASNSPRRKELLAGLDIEFSTYVKRDIDESFPEDMAVERVAEFLANKKAAVYQQDIKEGILVITADTVVIQNQKILGKPTSTADAIAMLKTLSGKHHQVITGVSMTTQKKQLSFSSLTDVTFASLSNEEIEYYVNKYQPYDKAGAYGIQEWIGFIGVEKMNGSYFNVMGLPVQQLYQELKKFK